MKNLTLILPTKFINGSIIKKGVKYVFGFLSFSEI